MVGCRLHDHLCTCPAPQSHLECRLWNDIFVESQRLLGIPNGAEAQGVARG